MRMTFGAILAAAMLCANAGATTDERRAEVLLRRWAEGLLSLQVKGTGNRSIDGNVMCPACGALHGRAADAVWPLTWLWARTGERRWLDAAKGLVTWARLNCERPDGAYINDPNAGWRGTTMFLQTALGKALLRFGDRLDDATRAEWRGMFDRQTAWLHKWMDDPNLVVNVNYRAGFALAMEVAYALDGDARHRASGDREARRVLGCIGADGLLYGEAKPMEAHSMRGIRGVEGRCRLKLSGVLRKILPRLFQIGALVLEIPEFAIDVVSYFSHCRFPPAAAKALSVNNTCAVFYLFGKFFVKRDIEREPRPPQFLRRPGRHRQVFQLL